MHWHRISCATKALKKGGTSPGLFTRVERVNSIHIGGTWLRELRRDCVATCASYIRIKQVKGVLLKNKIKRLRPFFSGIFRVFFLELVISPRRIWKERWRSKLRDAGRATLEFCDCEIFSFLILSFFFSLLPDRREWHFLLTILLKNNLFDFLKTFLTSLRYYYSFEREK